MTDSNRLAEFGSEVRRIRESRGMTLEDLAESSRLTVKFIEKVEKGLLDVSLSTVFTLARGLGIEPTEFVGGAPGYSADAVMAAWLVNQLPLDEQAKFLELMQSNMEDPPE